MEQRGETDSEGAGVGLRIKNCKEELKKWSRSTFKRADREIQSKKEELSRLQNSEFTADQQERIQALKESITLLWRQEEKFWGQRSRLKWLQWGDKNTAFFHATTIQRRNKNKIEKLKNTAGQWVCGNKELMSLIENHFSNLFSSTKRLNWEDCINKIPRKVTEEMNQNLLQEVTEKEVKDAVFSMGGLKAPGPDGLNGLFYQEHWEIISKEVYGAVKEFFNEGSLPQEFGETVVVLIPKTKNPECLNQLRPISCCNFIYKIIAKVMVMRLKSILEDIISPTQSAFVSGRLIQDNVIIVQEVYHSLNNRKNGGSQNVAIKLDMNKAYDRLEWDFLEKVLRAFGFHEIWVKRLMACVKSTHYRFKINGELSKKIIPQRGLRQGDPLSPYLFIIAAEVLTILMNEAQDKKLISGFKIASTAPTLTHLLFADDCIILAEACEEEIFQIISILNKYTEASGQRINLEKSGITFGSQVPIQTRVNIEEILGMTTWDSPGKYLGLPAYWGRSTAGVLTWIEEKVLNKLEGWKEKLLSQAGKEILIKAVIQAIPAYAMNVIKLPKYFCQRLSSKIAKFWWASSGKERGIHWKKWSSITKSKRDGGLGFKDLECQNVAHLAKQAWRAMKNPNAIWVQVLKAVYFPNSNFWDAKIQRNASWLWKSILIGRELLKRKGKWSIGSGSQVNIWRDRWISGEIRSEITENPNIQKVEEIITEGTGWNVSKIKDLFPPEVCEQILKTPISIVRKEDSLFWPFREDGNYSIKTGYQVAKLETLEGLSENPSTSTDNRELWKEIWNMNVPSKIRMFLWKAAQNIIPVNSNLYKRRLRDNPICSICKKEEETVEHAVLLCEWTRGTWFGAQCHCIPTKYTVTSFGNWLIDNILKIKRSGGDDHEDRISRIGFLSWEIWKARNKAVFEEQQTNPKSTIIRAKLMERTHREAIKQDKTVTKEFKKRSTQQAKWRPPPANWLKANVDAAFDKKTGDGAIAVVFRNDKGELELGFSGRIKAHSSLAAEANAIRQALIIVENLGMGRTLIESDNQQLIQAIKSQGSIGEIEAILQDIQILRNRLLDSGFTWIPRNGNRLAHIIAQLTNLNKLHASWCIYPTQEIAEILRKDKFRIS
ncbi:uncharacterized protein [Arachis hypogaea]|uniref:uncharacterized protein n=1 Tax=Arachis hypogaea TaxID=3818 RepID=UPI003B222728